MLSLPKMLAPDLFLPHPGLDDEINRNIRQSEIEGGVFLEDLLAGAVLENTATRSGA